jgi:hypothetical protein
MDSHFFKIGKDQEIERLKKKIEEQSQGLAKKQAEVDSLAGKLKYQEEQEIKQQREISRQNVMLLREGGDEAAQ